MVESDRTVSVVVPVYNSVATLAELSSRIGAALDAACEPFEIIFVDDGSEDSSWAAVEALSSADLRISGLKLASNEGQVAACLAGFSRSIGDVVVTIDADLENRPEDILSLVNPVRSGAVLVGGRRIGRRSRWRDAPSRLFNARVRLAGFPFRDIGCGLDAIAGDAARSLCGRGGDVEGLNFKPAIVALGGRVMEVDIGVESRHGSHYSAGALARLWLDFEVVHGPLTSRRLAALALSTLTLAVLGRSGRRGSVRQRSVAVAVAVVSLHSAGLVAASERRVAGRTGPLYSITESTSPGSEATGAGCSSP